MLRKILFSIFFLIAITFFPKTAIADDNFQTSVNTEYKVQEDGKTIVTNTISIQNKKSDFYPKSYVLTLSGVSPENIKAYESGNLLKISEGRNNSETQININFIEKSVGIGNVKTFVVSYEDKTLAQKSGEIWEITIPKIKDASLFDEYKVVLSVPKVFGEEAYLSPIPVSKKEQQGRIYYTFSESEITKTVITAGFGEFQVFDFKLNFHLDNETDKPITKEVAIPPDTSTQRMFYESMDPIPFNSKIDNDGNWIILYELQPSQKLDISVSGSSQLFASPRKLFNHNGEDLAKYLLPTTYWQSDNEKVLKIAKTLGAPKDIYDYVVKSLSYNYEKIDDVYKRKGAVGTIENPADSLCMEFTDLFIALSRAKGIPAREINGFAHSQNSKLEPLSLVTDILHAWPEYWDENTAAWVPVDPTWGNTTGGVDFFSKFDLRHLAFVIHGENPVLPYSAGSLNSGSVPDKDIRVTFGNLPENKNSYLTSSYKFEDGFPIFGRKVVFKLENSTELANYNTKIDIVKDSVKVSSINAPAILPFGSYIYEYNINYGFLASNAPDTIVVKTFYEDVEIPTGK